MDIYEYLRDKHSPKLALLFSRIFLVGVELHCTGMYEYIWLAKMGVLWVALAWLLRRSLFALWKLLQNSVNQMAGEKYW
jgi:hypothetical protein